MTKLTLEPIQRVFLQCRHALGEDENGNEVLLGLSSAESVEYFLIFESFRSSREVGLKSERFFTLYERHMAALDRCQRVGH
jgi:hypothetical protein